MKQLTFLPAGLHSDSTQFILNNGEIIAYVGIVITLLYCLISLFNVIKKSTSDQEKVEALKKQGKKLFHGTLHFSNADSFWNTKPSSVTGYFYEDEDKFVEVNGNSFYKKALQKTELKTI